MAERPKALVLKTSILLYRGFESLFILFFPMTFLDLKRLPVVQRANPHFIYYLTFGFRSFSSTKTLLPGLSMSSSTKTLLPGFAGLCLAPKDKMEQSKVIALSLIPVTVTNRISEIIGLVLDYHIASLQNALVNKTKTLGREGTQQALDFLTSIMGRRFFIASIDKGFSSIRPTMVNMDVRLILFAGSWVRALVKSAKGSGVVDRPKMVAQVLGSVTISNRFSEIVGLVLDNHIASLQKVLVNKTNDSAYEDTQQAFDFLTSLTGRRFFTGYILRAFSSSRAIVGTTDLRLILFAGSLIELAPLLCVFLKTGSIPSGVADSIAPALVVMCKDFKTFQLDSLREA